MTRLKPSSAHMHERILQVRAEQADLSELSESHFRAAARDFFQGERDYSGDKNVAAAYAVDAIRRVLGFKVRECQVVGAFILGDGAVAEMQTGEGKTVVAVLAACINTLRHSSIHIVTVNDYLAARDFEQMRQVFELLSISVGCVINRSTADQRREAYRCRVTYATNSELGFDYLRDNMQVVEENIVQQPFQFAIVDEVDAILIDEARTPLVISGVGEDWSSAVLLADKIVSQIEPADVLFDRKVHSVQLTDAGLSRVEQLLLNSRAMGPGTHLYDEVNLHLVPFIHQALKAHFLFEKDSDYLVVDDEVVIVDRNTGRGMHGRRFSEGLHQALEAKECSPVQPENTVLASITYQHFFRMYPRLSGMTGTAAQERHELAEIYGLRVISIPPHKAVNRVDLPDRVYRSCRSRDKAVVSLVREAHKIQRPVLVGTKSVADSERLSALLSAEGIVHSVLNARHHAREAEIIANAGRPGAVTIATSMAGRGTDILLGGEQSECANRFGLPVTQHSRRAVVAAGGLLVIGAALFDSKRVEDQLRGRSGRQGDPGTTIFLLSLEDCEDGAGSTIPPFKSDRFGQVVRRERALKHLRNWQKYQSDRQYDARRIMLKFDSVLNAQRLAFYQTRNEFLRSDNIFAETREILEATVDRMVDRYARPPEMPLYWDIYGLKAHVCMHFGLAERDMSGVTEVTSISKLSALLTSQVLEKFVDLWSDTPPDVVAAFVKQAILKALDASWQTHLAVMDHIKDAVGLRAYGQRDPLAEWHVEGAEQFMKLFPRAYMDALSQLSRFRYVDALEQDASF
ncbi:DEAD/DEAH box helicase [Thalassospira xianhensis]|uniref:preprotein translocase subunit SecA n=1 Tax=Thalassospira xianhensis TaxID=478503 RepID=UPI000DED8FFA|nr:DEAD/DEAH box helicase [Thalassospira xianhensis]